MPDLPRVVAESDVGSTAILEVWRKNKKIRIEVILGELPGEVGTERKTTTNMMLLFLIYVLHMFQN